MKSTYLDGVGKKMRNDFINGKISESVLIEAYNHNKREADNFSSYGLTAKELNADLRRCHNPLLKIKLQECIAYRNEQSKRSVAQNKLNLEKLKEYEENALGIGLRKVISKIKKASRKSHDKNLKIVNLLLQTEYANLCAKNHGKELKEIIYERKSRLLKQLSVLLRHSGWKKYGYNDNSGKNANYIVYIYLPNDVQLSWHANNYDVSTAYPLIDCEWDGKVCATLGKILDYIQTQYHGLLRKSEA